MNDQQEAPRNGPLGLAGELYHQDRSRDSHSTLEVFRDSPRKYHAYYVAGTLAREETKALAFGSALHKAVLEPNVFGDHYCVAPERWDLRTKAGKAALEDFKGKNPDTIMLWPEDWEVIDGIVQAIEDNTLAWEFVSAPGPTEHAIQWLDENTGTPLRAKLDKLVYHSKRVEMEQDPHGVMRAILDVKTCEDASPEAFAKSCANYGYHRQQALYQRGLSRAYETDAVVPFVFLACTKKPPFECEVYTLGADDVALGGRQNDETIKALHLAREFNCWSWPFHGSAREVRLPRWAHLE